MDITIATYWNVDTLYYIFNAVSALMTSAMFAGMLKMVFIFALGFGMFAYMGGKQLELFVWFFQALIFVSVLNLPISKVILVDKTAIQPPRVVDHVPFAMAVVAQVTNITFGSITEAYESAFGVPEELGLARGDVGFGHRILKQVNKAEIADPGLNADLMQFFKECTIYDIKDGQVSPQQLIGGTDVWSLLFSNTSPARFVTRNTLGAVPITDTCQNTAAVLKLQVDGAVVAAQAFYGKQMFPLAQSDAIATSMFINAAGVSYDWLLRSSQNASAAMRQSMFNNLWRQAGTALPAMLNDPAQVAEVAALTSQAQATTQANGSNSTMSLLGQETLPHMRNYLEAVLYAMFPVIVIFMVVVTTEGAKKIFAGYIMSLAWIGLWPVLFAVVNHLSLMYLQHKLAALSLSAGVPFQLTDAYGATLVDEQAMIGYMVVLVPFIAAGIVKMAQGGFMSVGDRVMAHFASAGGAAGSAAATGNVSMGQLGLDTQNVNTTSMNKSDTNLGLQGGGASIGTASGGTSHMGMNGTAAMQMLHNKFATSLNASNRLDSQRSEEAHASVTGSKGETMQSRHGDSASLSKVVGHDQTHSNQQSRGAESVVSNVGGRGGSHDKGEGLHGATRQAAQYHGTVGARDTLALNLGAGTGHGGPQTPAGPAMAPAAGPAVKGPNAKDEKRIAKAMEEGGASQAEIDKAIGNSRNSPASANPQPAANTQPGAKNAGGKGAKGGGGGPRISADIGMNSGKYYDASVSQNKSVDAAHVTDETAKTTTNWSETGTRNTRQGRIENSAQNDRMASDANRSTVDENTRSKDAALRSDQGHGNRANRSESNTFTKNKDLMSDPDFMANVAKRNGMSAIRFYAQETPTIMKQAEDYAAERGMVTAATKLNTATFAGESLPAGAGAVKEQHQKDVKEIPTNIDAKHDKNVGKTGFKGVEPVKVNTGIPAVGSDARDKVDAQLNPDNPNSIGARSADFDKNTNAWASPDKKLGEARVNPMALVEDMEKRDLMDTGSKVWDKMTGGDGSADGEKFSATMKREGMVPFENGNQAGGTADNLRPTSAAAPVAGQPVQSGNSPAVAPAQVQTVVPRVDSTTVGRGGQQQPAVENHGSAPQTQAAGNAPAGVAPVTAGTGNQQQPAAGNHGPAPQTSVPGKAPGSVAPVNAGTGAETQAPGQTMVPRVDSATVGQRGQQPMTGNQEPTSQAQNLGSEKKPDGLTKVRDGGSDEIKSDNLDNAQAVTPDQNPVQKKDSPVKKEAVKQSKDSSGRSDRFSADEKSETPGSHASDEPKRTAAKSPRARKTVESENHSVNTSHSANTRPRSKAEANPNQQERKKEK